MTERSKRGSDQRRGRLDRVLFIFSSFHLSVVYAQFPWCGLFLSYLYFLGALSVSNLSAEMLPEPDLRGGMADK